MSKKTNTDVQKFSKENHAQLGTIGILQKNATFYPLYRVNNIFKLLDIFQSTLINEELSPDNMRNEPERKTRTPHKNSLF